MSPFHPKIDVAMTCENMLGAGGCRHLMTGRKKCFCIGSGNHGSRGAARTTTQIIAGYALLKALKFRARSKTNAMGKHDTDEGGDRRINERRIPDGTRSIECSCTSHANGFATKVNLTFNRRLLNIDSAS